MRPDPDHATHDEGLVASLVARPLDLDPQESAAARATVAACQACRTLHDDLLALARALPASTTPPRPRHFTLTPEDAARLRRGGWRHLLARIGSARDTVTRPLAVGLTTFGIIGMLVASVPGALVGSSASGPSDRVFESTIENAMGASPQPFDSDEPPLPASEDGGLFQGTDQGDRAGEGGGIAAAPAPDEVAVRDDPSGLAVLFVLAGAMTIVGFGLFALRWSARRL
jgi:hypothetical protein